MNIVDVIKSKPEIIKRKLFNGSIEIKDFYNNGQSFRHYFENKNGEIHGECKQWWSNGTLGEHSYYEHGELVKDYLEEE